MNAVLRHSGAALAALTAAPAAAVALAVRPDWRVGWRERVGAVPRPAPGAVWVHAASVGEVLAATRLLDALAARGRSVLASVMTPAGRRVLAATRPEIPATFAPLPHPWAAARALARIRPAALVLVETELWPPWIAAAQRANVPVLVVSGRLSERSLRGYRRAGPLIRPTLARLAAVGARSVADAERFRALGVSPERVHVTGDLKLEPVGEGRPLAPELAAALPAAALVVAASSHDPEEAALLDALEAAEAAGVPALAVLAPRRLERVAAIEALVAGRGRRAVRRTELPPAPLAPGDVLILDTLGELPSLLPRAAVVFVGGSLAPRGGHNVLEPAHAGKPVLFGPHTGNVRDAARALLDAGAALQVDDAAALARAVVALLRDPEAARARGEAGRALLARHRGATRRTLALLESVLAATGGESA